MWAQTRKEEGSGYDGGPPQMGNGDQGRKGAVAVRTRGTGGMVRGLEGNVAIEYYGGTVPGGKNALLIAHRSEGRWTVCMRGQATFSLRSGLERVGRKWEMGAQPWVTQREGR